MSLSLDIVDVLRKKQGRIRTDIRLTNGQTIRPPKGTIWFIIGGSIYHVTGTSDGWFVRSSVVTGSPSVAIDVMIYNSSIISAEATNIYQIFNNVAEPYQAAPFPVVVQDEYVLYFLGSATAWFRPLVLEVKL